MVGPRCFTHLFSLPTYIYSQQQLLQSVGVHFHFRLVISVVQYQGQVHCDWRPRKYGYPRWNFADNPFHCIVPVWGRTFPFPVRYQPRTVSPIGLLNSATLKTWVLTSEFHKQPNPLPSYYYFRSGDVHFHFRLVISLGQCCRYVHWTRRPAKTWT